MKGVIFSDVFDSSCGFQPLGVSAASCSTGCMALRLEATATHCRKMRQPH